MKQSKKSHKSAAGEQLEEKVHQELSPVKGNWEQAERANGIAPVSLFLSLLQNCGPVQGVPGGGLQCGSAPHRPLHPRGLFGQTQANEPPHQRHSHLQGVHRARLQGGKPGTGRSGQLVEGPS